MGNGFDMFRTAHNFADELTFAASLYGQVLCRRQPAPRRPNENGRMFNMRPWGKGWQGCYKPLQTHNKDLYGIEHMQWVTA